MRRARKGETKIATTSTPKNYSPYYYSPNNPNNTYIATSNKTVNAPVATKNIVTNAAQKAKSIVEEGAKALAAMGRSGSGSGSGGGGYYEAPSYDPSGAINDQYNELLAQSKAANQRILDALKANFENSTKNINANYDLQQKTSEQDSADALRQAYINYMMSRRNIDGDLARAGYTGGLAESNKARMYNNYGTNRNAIRTLLAQNLEKINTARNAELNDIQSEYNTALANQYQKYYDREMAIRQNLANALLSI